MNINFLRLLVLFVFIVSCKKSTESNGNNTIDDLQSEIITESDISNLDYTEYVLDTKTEIALESWLKYHELVTMIDDVKRGDLTYFSDPNSKKNIENFFIALKKLMPEALKTATDSISEPEVSPSIMARILVFETKMYKLESFSNLSTTTKEELGETIKEYLIAFSNFNFQMNKKLEKDGQQIEKP
jgi:hypothetical protein